MPGWIVPLALVLWPLAFTFLFRPERLGRTAPTGPALNDEQPSTQVTPAAAGSSAATLAVIIPARNEEHNLPQLLQSLQSQTRVPDEVIVVDDNSTDRTTAVARAAGTRVLQLPEPPPGWVGKTRACAKGAEASTAELLLFLDADCRLAPTAIEFLIAAHGGSESDSAAHGGQVSDDVVFGAALHSAITVQPYHTMKRAYEQLSAFFNVVLIAGVAAFTWPRTRAPRGAFGPCLLVPRVCYTAAGGHAAIRSEVLDDVALGARLQESRCVLRFFIGGDQIAFRMYPNGLRELIEGWTKNFAVASSRTPLIVLIALTAWFTGAALAARAAISGLSTTLAAFVEIGATEVTGGDGLLYGIAGLLTYALYSARLHAMLRAIGAFSPVTALLYPVGLAFFAGVYLRSLLFTYVLRRVTWKGRRITPTG